MTGTLTPREIEAMRLRQRGVLLKQMEGELGVTRNTVDTHFKNIAKKYKTHSSYQALTLFLAEYGFGDMID